MTGPHRPLASPDALAEAGLITPETAATLAAVAARYAVAITPAVAAAIDADDPRDPLAMQYVPDLRELAPRADELADPIADEANSPLPGLVHRYPDRVLMKVASICPVYCRFCFRRERVGPDHGQPLDADAIVAAIDYIRARPQIWEVILTGGDPLVLSPRRIRHITEALAAIPHVKVLRWHTRVPVVAPDRITSELVAALRATPQAVYVALHANHPRELTAQAREACARLVDGGVVMVSQTVLLAGINDDAATLDALMRAFVESRVKPYYLHHLDRAPGTAHFRTSIATGQALMRELRGRLSGIAQPTYVLDLPGGHGKMPIGPSYACGQQGSYRIEDYNGATHDYCDCPPDNQAASRP